MFNNDQACETGLQLGSVTTLIFTNYYKLQTTFLFSYFPRSSSSFRGPPPTRPASLFPVRVGNRIRSRMPALHFPVDLLSCVSEKECLMTDHNAEVATEDPPVACSVCFEAVADGNGRSTANLRCGHQFHLDCIGSAFNAKGAMQCPNCRHIEKGKWLLLNDHLSSPDNSMDIWTYDENVHGPNESETPFEGWCPFHITSSFNEHAPSPAVDRSHALTESTVDSLVYHDVPISHADHAVDLSYHGWNHYLSSSSSRSNSANQVPVSPVMLGAAMSDSGAQPWPMCSMHHPFNLEYRSASRVSNLSIPLCHYYISRRESCFSHWRSGSMTESASPQLIPSSPEQSIGPFHLSVAPVSAHQVADVSGHSWADQYASLSTHNNLPWSTEVCDGTDLSSGIGFWPQYYHGWDLLSSLSSSSQSRTTNNPWIQPFI